VLARKDGDLMTSDKLNQKQKRFCEEILVDDNATKAAIRAGYSKRSAYSIGHENMQKPKIKRYISQLKATRNLRTQVTTDRILLELAKIGFAKAEKGKKNGDKLKALGMLGKHAGIFDNQFNFEKQQQTSDLSEIDPIEHKSQSIEFYNQMIHNSKIQTKFKLAAQKQLIHLLGLDQIPRKTPEEFAAMIREALIAMDESVPSCPEKRAKLNHLLVPGRPSSVQMTQV
jgi:phage terminase small subunit